MKSPLRFLLALIFASTLLGAAACGGGSTSTASHADGGSTSKSGSSSKSESSGSSSSSVSESPGNSNGVQLDPAVSMPGGFPSDFPIYKGARLTEQGQYKSGGTTMWGMTWETVDPVEQVGKWYEAELNQGDWTVSYSGSTTGNYSVMFTRRSNGNEAGILGVVDNSGFTKITAAFGIG